MACRIASVIDPNINIESKALLDMISETELSIATNKGAGTRGPSKLANPGRKINVSEAFDNW